MDKITQLQEQLGKLSFLYFQMIRSVHEKSPSLSVEELEKLNETENEKVQEYKKLKDEILEMKKEILKASQEFDNMLDQLEGINLSKEKQLEEIVKLNRENQQKGEELINNMEKCEDLSQRVSNVLTLIAKDKLEYN